MTSPSETADDPQMMQEDDQSMPERMPDPRPAAQAEVWHPTTAVAGSTMEEPGSMAQAEEPLVFPAPSAGLASVPEPSATSDTASPDTRWHEILAKFVDDPRSSVELAAGLVDDDIQALVMSLKSEQDSLLAAWHGEDTGTEELRTAVQHYHSFGNRLADFQENHA
jgi:hypothetical protein